MGCVLEVSGLWRLLALAERGGLAPRLAVSVQEVVAVETVAAVVAATVTVSDSGFGGGDVAVGDRSGASGIWRQVL